MKIFFVFSFCVLVSFAYPQSSASSNTKAPLNFSDFENWPFVRTPKICSNGKYVIYTITNQPLHYNTLVVTSSDGRWRKQFPYAGSNAAEFTTDCKNLIFINDSSTLNVYNLSQETSEQVPNVKNFRLFSQNGMEWLAYKLKSKQNELVLTKMVSKAMKKFQNVNDYYFFNSNSGSLIVAIENINGEQLLLKEDLSENIADTIFKGMDIKDMVFDESLKQFAFISRRLSNNISENIIWYYTHGMAKAKELRTDANMSGGLQISSLQRFSKDGARIFLALKAPDKQKNKSYEVNVDVWSYLDPSLQSAQLAELLNYGKEYKAVTNIENSSIIQLEKDFEQSQFPKPYKRFKEEWDLIIYRMGSRNEANWNFKSNPQMFLISLKNGERKPLNVRIEIKTPYSYTLSPLEKYVVYYDPNKNNYFSYELATGIYRNITNKLKCTWTVRNDEPSSHLVPNGFLGFTDGDKDVLLYDKNDIFQISLDASKSPINLTNSYGTNHNIVFRLASNHADSTFKKDEVVILNAFDRSNKQNGFYSMTVGRQRDPKLLTMQPCIFIGSDQSSQFPIVEPIKSKNSNQFVVRKMTASEAPNYFTTTDFKLFTQLSSVYPEKNYNWLSSELIRWKTLNGNHCEGILYKPANFDSTKKYPVIFYYYVRYSNGLHGYLTPSLSDGDLNISYFVSNGYLVFLPDIQFQIGFPGRSAFNSIVSAAKHIAKFPWVDSQRMGLQGHSFGGFETNYIIAHTKIFAAACSSAGMSNFVSAYGSIMGMEADSRQRQYELYNDRMGFSLWKGKQQYLENSPVLDADRITTPLLMVANRDDDDVPWQQGLEFFTGLRRLGKKVWMLQYDGQGHLLFGKAEKDFTIRMKQFFDHYLKDTPAPKWMTRGIPASMKGIDDGLELDTEIKTPGSGLLIEDEN